MTYFPVSTAEGAPTPQEMNPHFLCFGVPPGGARGPGSPRGTCTQSISLALSGTCAPSFLNPVFLCGAGSGVGTRSQASPALLPSQMLHSRVSCVFAAFEKRRFDLLCSKAEQWGRLGGRLPGPWISVPRNKALRMEPATWEAAGMAGTQGCR